jgi:hypothetical protein
MTPKTSRCQALALEVGVFPDRCVWASLRSSGLPDSVMYLGMTGQRERRDGI